MATPEDENLIQALLHTLLEFYGNNNVYHPDGTVYSLSDLKEVYLRDDQPKGEAREMEILESSMDSTTQELIGLVGNPMVNKAYYLFREMLHDSIKDKYPCVNFSNF